jgi:hypothetical protein
MSLTFALWLFASRPMNVSSGASVTTPPATVTVTPAEVVVLPAASRATAVSV